MKNDDGFRPGMQKEEAVQKADHEEIDGSLHPQVPAFTAIQTADLSQLDEELKTIQADIEADFSKAAGYVGELQQTLDDVQALPHDERYAAISETLEEQLQTALHLAEQGSGKEAAQVLEQAIQTATSLLLHLSK